jgi:hypothetical protein
MKRSVNGFMSSSDRVLANDELGRMMKKFWVTYFKVLSQHLYPASEEIHENISQDSRCPGRDSNRVRFQYKQETLTLPTTLSETRNRKINFMCNNHIFSENDVVGYVMLYVTAELDHVNLGEHSNALRFKTPQEFH